MTRGISLLAAAVIALLALPTGRAGAAPTTLWTVPAAMPANSGLSPAQAYASPLGGALLFYNLLGVPTLSQVKTDGTLADPQLVPKVTGQPRTGIPEQIAFLPDGGAIVSWKLNGAAHAYMAYRTPGGTFRAPVQLPDTLYNLSARAGEVVTIEGSGSGVSVESWTLSATGALTLASGPTDIWTGAAAYGKSYVALDADGGGTAVIFGQPNGKTIDQVSAVARASNRVWSSTPTLLSTVDANVSDLQFATSPGGRAIINWVEPNADNTLVILNSRIREPDQGFGPASIPASDGSAFGAFIYPVVAAGTDGTLAEGYSEQLFSSASVSTTTSSIRIVAPAATTAGAATQLVAPIPPASFSSISAGHGRALTGWVGQLKGAPKVGFPNSYSYIQSDQVSIFYPDGSIGTKALGFTDAYYDPVVADGCDCAIQPPGTSVSGVSLDLKGQTTALGQLAQGQPLSYSTRGDYPVAKPVLKLGSKALTATKKVAVPLSCTKANCAGKLSLVAVIKHKPVTLTKKSAYAVELSASKTVKLAVTKAGKKALKNAKNHTVHATLGATVTGGKSLAKKVAVKK